MKLASEIIFDPKCEIYESFMVIDTIEIYNENQVTTTAIFHGVYDRAEEAYQIALHLFEKTSTGTIMKDDNHDWLWEEELKKKDEKYAFRWTDGKEHIHHLVVKKIFRNNYYEIVLKG